MHSLEEFVAATIRTVGRDWRDHVRLSDAFCRPTDIRVSRANPERARQVLAWRATLRMPSVIERLIAAERTRRKGG
jgi:GDPmannose 4,6-dehydratase